MTATTKTDRRKQVRLLQDLRQRLKDSGDDKVHSMVAAVASRGFKLHDEAFAIGVALGYMARHMNLATGELTVSLEPLEPAE